MTEYWASCTTCPLYPDLAEGFIEETDTLVRVGFGNVHGRGHADGIAVEAAFADEQAVGAGAFHDLICFLRGRLFGFAVFHKFECLQHTHAANVADERILLLQLFELSPQVAADYVSILKKIFFLDHFDDGPRRDGRDRIAAERGDIQSLEFAGEFRGSDRNSSGNAVGHALGGGDDIRRDFPLLDAPPLFARAAPTGLHFVGDEKAAIIFHDRKSTR